MIYMLVRYMETLQIPILEIMEAFMMHPGGGIDALIQMIAHCLYYYLRYDPLLG